MQTVECLDMLRESQWGEKSPLLEVFTSSLTQGVNFYDLCSKNTRSQALNMRINLPCHHRRV